MVAAVAALVVRVMMWGGVRVVAGGFGRARWQPALYTVDHGHQSFCSENCQVRQFRELSGATVPGSWAYQVRRAAYKLLD